MKKIRNLCLMLIVLVLISSCSASGNNSSEISDTEISSSRSNPKITETEASLDDITEAEDSGFESFEESAVKAGKIAGEIFECFKDRDGEKLKGFFSQYISDKYDLDAQIEEAFAFIDGEILSSDNPTGMPSGSAVEDGIWIKRELSGEIENIKTDSGKTYEIKIEYLAIEKKNPDKVGCSRVLILETTSAEGQTNKIIIGE